MIVPRAQITLILNGRKRVHRIPVGKLVKTGRPLAVKPARTGPASCRIIITGQDRQRLGDVDGVQALEEGHKSLDDFRAGWVAHHEPRWVDVQRLQMERFGMPEAEIDDTLREYQLNRFGYWWANRDCWALRFELDREPPVRLLAARSEELYTTEPARAMVGEPEAPDAADLERFRHGSQQAWDEERAHRLKERQNQPLHRRLELVQQEARGNPAASKRLRLIEQQVAKIEADISTYTQPGEAS